MGIGAHDSTGNQTNSIFCQISQNIAKHLRYNSIDNTLTVHFIVQGIVLNFRLVQNNFMNNEMDYQCIIIGILV